MGAYGFKHLNTGKITTEEYLMNAYVEGVLASEHIHTSTKWLRTILDAKKEKLRFK